ncbi:tripartite tricarboxylate transporter substrate binding protein [Acidovorax sp. sic0104]|uniref:Bug family tripartite tricarboxylate transporter substrate binding protein n=1 Tax=Acidovorax sp. sic0104 TaxID=2854784 RepID=UPI001C481D8C|nr:tripartite tricarboxylate transporter substrate binding protein [Acidovorax sp. sic0104]MBV7542296.1 tripartite tricarboxylate transporter substrate binding protein [Acidovorax sp. sic0104]
MRRNQFLSITLRTALGTATLAMAAGSFAQAYPTKPVRVVIPFPPGGTLDTVGRQLAQKLGEQMGQNFIVENKPGGNGVIGGDVVAKAQADGYTLLFNASTFTTAPMTMKSVPYGVVKDFTPVALVAKAPLSVAINKNLPVTDIKSLMAYAKANPGKMTFAVGSIGSAGHLSTELLKRAGQLDYLIVPYKGTAPAFQDLIGGQIDGFIDPILGSLQYHKSGMLRVVAVTSAQRAASLPDVPTVGETIPGYEFYSWYGLWGPAKLPADITQRLNTEVNKALAEMTPKLREQGLLTTPGSVEDFAKFQRSDMERSQKIVTEGNIRVE